MKIKMNFSMALCLTVSVAMLIACQKGEPVNFQEYMKMDVAVYCEDTSLYVEGRFNDTSFYSNAAVRSDEVFNLYTASPAELIRPRGDSGKLTITVVKKNNRNLVFDSIISVSNYNDMLLVELDPNRRPYLINKKIASSTLPKPAGDSIKVRFYFNSSDPTIRNSNYPDKLVTSLDLELWAIKEVDGIPQPVNINRKIRVRADQLTEEYVSLNRNDQHAWRLLDVSGSHVASNKRVIETFEYSPDFEVFTRGYIEFDPDAQNFQTFKITQTFEPLYTYEYGINGKFLFGFQ